MLYLVFLFACLFLFLAWTRPVLAIQLTLFALPAYLIRFNLGVPMTLLELMILLNFGVWFVKNFKAIGAGLNNRWQGKEQVIDYPFGLEMILVAVVGLAGVWFANFSNSALGVWRAYFFEPILLMIVIYQILGTLELKFSEKYKKIVWPLILSGLAVAALAIYQKLTGQLISNSLWAATETRRVVSFFGYPNAVGLYLETLVIYVFGLIMLVHGEHAKKIKLSLLVLMHVLILSIIFAKSVGAVLGLASGFAIFSILYSKQSRKFFAVCFAVATMIVFILPSGRTNLEGRLFLQDFSGQVRLIGWQETWKMLSDGRLLSGAGLSKFQDTVAPYHMPGFYFNKNNETDFHRKLVIFNQAYRDKYWQPLEIYMYPHNIILNFWSETGLFGVLIFMGLLIRFYFLALSRFRLINQESKIQNQEAERIIIITILSAMTTIIVHGLVDVPFFKNDLAIIFWLPIVILGLYQLEQKLAILKERSKSIKLS